MASLTKCDICGKIIDRNDTWYAAEARTQMLSIPIVKGDICGTCLTNIRALSKDYYLGQLMQSAVDARKEIAEHAES